MATDVVEITRYPNRRLYDRSQGQYVTLTEIEAMVREGRTVLVRDSKSGEDLTRAVLAQIILERHPERMDLFPVSLLHMVLRANDLALDWMRTYMRQSLAFLEQMPQPLTAAPPFAPPLATSLVGSIPTPLDWMKVFFPTPPATPGDAESDTASAASPGSADRAPTTPPPDAEAQAALLERLAELERRLRELESQRGIPATEFTKDSEQERPC